jgi:hypothetical protein
VSERAEELRLERLKLAGGARRAAALARVLHV